MKFSNIIKSTVVVSFGALTFTSNGQELISYLKDFIASIDANFKQHIFDLLSQIMHWWA